MTALHDTAAAMASVAQSMLELAVDNVDDPAKRDEYMDKHEFYARHAEVWANLAEEYDAELMALEDEDDGTI